MGSVVGRQTWSVGFYMDNVLSSLVEALLFTFTTMPRQGTYQRNKEIC